MNNNDSSDDLVINIPADINNSGSIHLNVRSYAGYAEAGFKGKEAQLFYWFFESQKFHPDQSRNTEEIGQAPRLNVLAHGPPGTGKSTFAYRVARALQRHVINVDLRVLKSKYDIYKQFLKPQLQSTSIPPSSCVFVLEEFDITVKHLYQQKKIREQHLKIEKQAVIANELKSIKNILKDNEEKIKVLESKKEKLIKDNDNLKKKLLMKGATAA